MENLVMDDMFSPIADLGHFTSEKFLR